MSTDPLSLLHPSLGLAFTDVFRPGLIVPHHSYTTPQATFTFAPCSDRDRIPTNCPGCREHLDGSPICCQERDE